MRGDGEGGGDVTRTRLTLIIDMDSPYKAVRFLRGIGVSPTERGPEYGELLTSASLISAEFHDVEVEG